MNTILKITKRELAAYFTTPIGYVFMISFILLQMFFVIELYEYFDRNSADMTTFFELIPFVYLVFIPAIGMRLWSEERRTGTIEILLTLPISIQEAVIGKFLAAWVFVLISLLATITFPLTVLHLGSPDVGVIIANYIGAFLIGGAYLSIASFCSALTKNQIISLIISVLVSLAFLFMGHKSFLLLGQNLIGTKLSWLGVNSESIMDFIGSFSFWKYQVNIKRGVIDSRDIIFFLVFISTVLFFNVLLINRNKAK